MDQHAEYYKQDLSQTWSHPTYYQFGEAEWEWRRFPFIDNCSSSAPRDRFYGIKNNVQGKSILEIGSAMGRAYSFLKKSNMVDLSQYSGIEISETGYTFCKTNYPEANWLQRDFTRYKFEQQFDYAFERDSIHHMPDPIAQYRKLLKHINLGVTTGFRGCMEGETISDLEKGFFRQENQDRYYLNVINIFDVVQIALEEGFNHIQVGISRDLLPMPTDVGGQYYLAPEVQENRSLQFFTVFAGRCLGLSKPLVYASGVHWLREPRKRLKLWKELKIMTKRYYSES